MCGSREFRGRDRADEVGDGAALCSLGSAGPAGDAGRAVAGAVLGTGHGLGHHGDLAGQRPGRRGQQVRVGSEHHDLGLDPLCRGRDSAAEAEDRQLERVRPDDRRRLRAARPGRLGEFLDGDVGEAEVLERLHAPVLCADHGRRADLARSHLGGQVLEQGPGEGIGERLVAQGGGGVGGFGGERGGRQGEDGREGEHGNSHVRRVRQAGRQVKRGLVWMRSRFGAAWRREPGAVGRQVAARPIRSPISGRASGGGTRRAAPCRGAPALRSCCRGRASSSGSRN